MSYVTEHSINQTTVTGIKCCRAEVVFGTPSRNCDGVGICHISGTDHTRVRWKCPSFMGWLQVQPSGRIKMTFDRSVFPLELFQRCFSGQYFDVEETYRFPGMVNSLLGLSHYEVKAGRYEFEVSEFFISILI